MVPRLLASAIVPSCILFFAGQTNAATLLDFEDAGISSEFEGDVANDTAGPFSIDGVPAVVTTLSVTGFLDLSPFGLGINSGGGDPASTSFNIGESWTFQISTTVSLDGIDIGGLQNQESFRLSSSAWINLGGVVPGVGVVYDAPSGTFTLVDDSVPSDLYTSDYLTGGVDLIVPSGVAITIGDLTSTFGPNDEVELQSLTLTAIPEPSISLLVGLGLLSLLRRWR